MRLARHESLAVPAAPHGRSRQGHLQVLPGCVRPAWARLSAAGSALVSLHRFNASTSLSAGPPALLTVDAMRAAVATGRCGLAARGRIMGGAHDAVPWCACPRAVCCFEDRGYT